MLQYAPRLLIGETALIPDRDRPISVAFSAVHLHITLANGRTISVLVDDYPTLTNATSEQRNNVQLGLSGIYWPDLDLDISLLELLSGAASPVRSHKPRFCEG